MFSLIYYKTFPNLNFSARSLLFTHNCYGSKSVVESSKQSKKQSFSVSCDFSPGNCLKSETSDRENSVLLFLKHHGFTESQVSIVVQKDPEVVLCDPKDTLLPKIEFFRSLGFSVEDYTHILCRAPDMFKLNLKDQFFPTIDFLEKLLSSPEKVRACVKRCPWIFTPPCRDLMEDNVRVLMEMGVDKSRISQFVYHQPRLFVKDEDKFRAILGEIKKLGFNPSRRSFLAAVHVFGSLSKSSWEKKIAFFKKWGLSEDKILGAFEKNPWLMVRSEEKILEVMGFIVYKMGFKSSFVLKYPVIIGYSLTRRIVPRCLVYRVLGTKGLLVKNTKLLYFVLKLPEEKFLKEYVECYEKEVPELLELYQSCCPSKLTEDSLSSPQNT